MRAAWIGILLAACASDEPGECLPQSQSQRDVGAFILFSTCLGCHSENLAGDLRHGAPAGLDFNDADAIAEMAADIVRTAEEGSMPPETAGVPPLSDEQVDALRAFVACSE